MTRTISRPQTAILVHGIDGTPAVAAPEFVVGCYGLDYKVNNRAALRAETINRI